MLLKIFDNDAFQNFFAEKTFLKIPLENWFYFLLIMLGAILLCLLLQFLNKKVFQKVANKTKNNFDNILLQSLESPVLWGIILIGLFVGFSQLGLSSESKIQEHLNNAFKILTSLNVTWFFARLLSSLLEETARNAKNDNTSKKHLDRKFLPLFRRVLLIVVWSIGVIMALGNAGISIGSLLATLGIGGIAFALAAQDTIKNILGGITIFIDQPFRIGDTIRYDTVEGAVEDIGLRSTRIRTYEKRLVTVPNYKIMDASITNITKEPKRRVLIKLGLVYDTTPEKMQEALQILRSLPKKIENVDAKDWAANFTDYGDSALLITYIYNIKKGADIAGTTSAMNFEILNSFNNAGLEFAFPSQTIYLEKDQNPESVKALSEKESPNIDDAAKSV